MVGIACKILNPFSFRKHFYKWWLNPKLVHITLKVTIIVIIVTLQLYQIPFFTSDLFW